MNRVEIELKKIEREIKRNGSQYKVIRDVLDDYKEPTGETEEIVIVSGLFHTVKGYQSRSVSDNTIVHAKGSPMLLCVYEDAKDIKPGDYVLINDNRYKVCAKNNVQEYNIVCDISMELILDENKG